MSIETELNDAQPFWDFDERDDVKELTQQLHGGLLHSLEYAVRIQRLADEAGLQL